MTGAVTVARKIFPCWDRGDVICNCKFINSSPAKIEKFLVYSAQDSHRHKTEDVYGALRYVAKEYTPNVIDVGITLTKLYDEDNSDWEVVKQYLDECVHGLKDPDAEADGGKFEANRNLSATTNPESILI